MLISMRKRALGFTVLELMAVVAIIAVLASLTFPVLSRAKMQGKVTASFINLKQLHQAITIYQDAWDGSGYGFARDMGLPPLHVDAIDLRAMPDSRDLWFSPCGPSLGGIPGHRGPLFPAWDYHEQRHVTQTWYRHVVVREENSVLVLDPNCTDRYHDGLSEYLTTEVNFLRLSGQVARRAIPGNILDLKTKYD
jgi:prepilin-type N-terminal cleavage/methylation domain-containing protein